MYDVLQTTVAIIVAVTGLGCALQAWRGWARTERALRHRRPLPGTPANILVSAGVALVAVCLLVTATLQAW